MSFQSHPHINHFRLTAKTIADIYMERWQIEIFFRWINHYLEVNAFIVNSEKAEISLISAVLIVYLMLCYAEPIAKYIVKYV
jgi:IS4 transposase